VVAFSTVDRASFEAVRKWKRKVEDECCPAAASSGAKARRPPMPMVLVQNKIDLAHKAEILE